MRTKLLQVLRHVGPAPTPARKMETSIAFTVQNIFFFLMRLWLCITYVYRFAINTVTYR
jgi:hypothetical protein